MNTLDQGHATFNGAHVPINGDQTPQLTVNSGVKSISEKCNGVLAHNSTSPSADSPTTPISVTASPDVKIDIDYQEQESDVRHEPLQIKHIDRVDKLDGGSFFSQVEAPGVLICSMSSLLCLIWLDIPSPNHTPPLVDDMNVEESDVPVMNGMNGHVNGTASDVVMRDEDSQTPAPPAVTPDASMATIPSNGTSTSHSSPRDHPPPIDNGDMPPPAKRARMHSNADRASFMHVSLHFFIYIVTGVLISSAFLPHLSSWPLHLRGRQPLHLLHQLRCQLSRLYSHLHHRVLPLVRRISASRNSDSASPLFGR